MKVYPINIFLPLGRSKQDDLLIIANSFEERCSAFVEKLVEQDNNYRPNSTIIFFYSDRNDNSVKQRATKNLDKIKHFATILSGNNVNIIYSHPYDIFNIIDSFKNIFSTLPYDSSIVIDISTIPKINLFYLLNEAVLSTRISNVRLVYTRPRYGKYDALSWGAEEPFILPYFGKPKLYKELKSCLLLFCGLEPDRSYSIWKRFGKDRCIKVFIDTGDNYSDRITNRAIRLHNFEQREEYRVVPAFQPDIVKSFLNDIYKEVKSQGFYLYIAPLTTKWEAIAVWDFFKDNKNNIMANIVYCSPGRFNTTGYSIDYWKDILYSKI